MSARSTLSLLLLAMCLLHTGLAQECPVCHDDGYEVFSSMPGSRYKLSPLRLNWVEAFQQCQSDGGGSNLVVINSDIEAEVVKTLVTRLDDNGIYPYAWVGINDINTEGVWRTVFGGLVSESGYNKWGVGYPSGGTLENCGLVGTEGLFYDDPCSDVRSFTCEKPNV